MIHGKPVVSTRVGGIPEIITHLENGYLVPPDDPEALAGAISELSGNAALRRELGAAGVATVHERFTHRHTGSNFERLFSDLIRQDEVVTIRDKVHR
jgi:glycosyltransferase involved in cell wall biosynthesis